MNLFTLYPISFLGMKQVYDEGESPIDYLHQAAVCYATAIKNKPKDPTYHLQLGQVLEEKYYAEDIMGLKKEVRIRSCRETTNIWVVYWLAGRNGVVDSDNRYCYYTRDWVRYPEMVALSHRIKLMSVKSLAGVAQEVDLRECIICASTKCEHGRTPSRFETKSKSYRKSQIGLPMAPR